jgi:antitoxin YobK
VSAAEATLGLKFPSGYRLFVTQLGAGSFGAQEILGGDFDDFVNSGTPDSLWKTLKDREQLDLPASMIVIYFDGGVDFFVLDTAESEDGDPMASRSICTTCFRTITDRLPR